MTDETASAQGEDRCPTCGAAVRVIGCDEGTMHFEPTVPAPSDEAVGAAGAAIRDCEIGTYITYATLALTAAYAIDLPRLLAEARAEAEAGWVADRRALVEEVRRLDAELAEAQAARTAETASVSYRLWVDDASTVLVRIWSNGTAEVATREDPGAIWSPPTMLREEQV